MIESSAGGAGRRQKVQAAEVGTDILTALAELAPATSLSRLAEHVGMPASKVHRYLQALIASGFAEQDATTNHYGLGPAALFVGLAALGRLDVVKLATPYLAELRDELNETCFLAVWGNRGPTVVHVEQAVRAVTLVTQVGSVLPLLGSSTGLVFNAFLADAETADLRDLELQKGSELYPDGRRQRAFRAAVQRRPADRGGRHRGRYRAGVHGRARWQGGADAAADHPTDQRADGCAADRMSGRSRPVRVTEGTAPSPYSPL